jgi:endonuclease YncB( thermonuclease family)
VIFRALATIILLLLGFPAFAQDICGFADVKDGDDLVIADVEIRLHGIDAFEANQTCTRSDGKTWACGEAARRKLEELTTGAEETSRSASGQVCCERMKESKTRGRVVMRCLAGQNDVGQEMVRAGLAFDCPRHSREHYKADEAGAKAAKRGAWEGTFKPPWVQRGKTYCCTDEFPRQFCP